VGGTTVLGGSGWANYRYASTQPGGVSFLTYWEGSRSLLASGESPYSPSVGDSIRAETSAWPVGEAYPELRPTYPLYAGIFTLPFASVSEYALARALWMSFLQMALMVLAALNIRLAKWSPGWRVLPLYVLFAFFWLHSLLPLVEGSAVLLVATLVAAFFLALRPGHDELAGLALALSTIIPTAVLLLIGYVAVWSLFQRRWVLLVWLFGSLALLTAGGMVFVPDWPLQWLRTLLAAPDPLAGYSTRGVFAQWWPGVGLRLGWVLSGLVGLILLVEWWLSTRKQDFSAFFWTASLTLAASPLTGLPTSPVNHILLFIPLVFISAVWIERMGRAGLFVTLLTMALLFVLPWVWFLNNGGAAAGSTPLAQLLLPLPVFTFLGLYWIRWWALRPQRFYVNEMRAREEI
jgi:hypothetical protein